MSRHVESTVRTNRLHCSDCSNKIRIGDDAIFELSSGGRMINVYCKKCKSSYMREAIEDSEHPFSSESLGQWD